MIKIRNIRLVLLSFCLGYITTSCPLNAGSCTYGTYRCNSGTGYTDVFLGNSTVPTSSESECDSYCEEDSCWNHQMDENVGCSYTL